MINLTHVAHYERAENGKIYPAGVSYIPLSAISGPEDKVNYLKEPGEIESRYCVVSPKEGTDPYYLYVALCQSVDEFLAKYQTTINLQYSALRNYRLAPFPPLEKQQIIGRIVQAYDRLLAIYKRLIELYKEFKRFLLDVMFPKGR